MVGLKVVGGLGQFSGALNKKSSSKVEDFLLTYEFFFVFLKDWSDEVFDSFSTLIWECVTFFDLLSIFVKDENWAACNTFSFSNLV